ncbi:MULTISPECIES: transporter substrate-binding domain-containing protein [Burkholderiaceae]|jgi:glutamate/aspartate transport system substrate-binding protein|uniref:Amino acid ABC transporter substrate-binding protein n=1 Tax=Burkholderia aenigmatica TaxID=2015348 RepID=A0A6J5JI60_9BURK|nr:MULTISPECIES: transporter substrate-binding domain-containing protein [Burkholderiaceae]KAB0601791.1 transporter substrate-binding domain-containing protein [Cupriavidus pauculus]MBR8495144.1 transporter substrate-binding domain-containing protein [Burkholderia cenocepacia]MCO8393858.1 transporter substrate-binding domain-containing protein [Burkholderia cenocepacia]MCO8402214.1 transporter substrate-binding domain-containing protein [Burkholderia cenocepacia]MCO8416371.1 transporter substr
MKLKTIVTYALSATLAFTATSSFAGEVTDRIIHSKTFNVGSRESSIPYSEKTANGYKGYSQEICAIIHAEFDKQHKVTTTINYVPVDGTTRWPSVQSGNADAECGSTTVKEEKKNNFDFAVIDSDSVVVATLANNTNVKNLESLKDARVDVVAGSTGEIAINQLKNKNGWNTQINSVKEYSLALKDVESGKADAFITDKDLLVGTIKKSGSTNFKVRDDIVLVPHEPIAIVTSKKDPEFSAFVKGKVLSMIKDGSLWKLHDKYFGPLGLSLTEVQKQAIAEQR